MNLWLFGIECVVLLIVTISWAAWAYNNNKLSPMVILITAMGETGILAAGFTYAFLFIMGV